MTREAISMTGRGARGESFSDIARRTGTINGVSVPADASDTQVMNLLVQSVLTQVLTGVDLPFYTDLATAHAAVATGDEFVLGTAGGGFQRRQRTVSGSDVLMFFPPPPAGYFTETVGGQPVSVPYSQVVTDLFIVIGQSNALGQGDDTKSPAAANGVQVETDGDIISLDDPMTGADPNTGSMWPAFSNAYYEATGRLSAFVQKAQGGTSMVAAANPSGNWSSTGTLRADAVTAARTAIDALSESQTHILGNVFFIMAQGEQDAQQLFAGTPGVTGAAYSTEAQALAQYLKDEIPTMQSLLLVTLGRRNNRAEAAAWAEIRNDGQVAAANASDLIRIVYRGATGFPADSFGRIIAGLTAGQDDQLHWGQYQLNLAGTCAAIEAAKRTPSAVPDAPAILAKEGFVDTDFTAATSRTVSHTTAALTKALIVGVVGMRPASASGASTSGVTYNGIAMTELLNASTTAANGATGTSATSAVGHARVKWFMLTETAYGSTLAGVTANIVVTQSLSTALISLAAYDLDVEPLVETAAFAVRVDGSEGTDYEVGYTAAAADGLTTGAPCLMLAAVGTIGDGAAKMTHSWSAGITEDYDDGNSDGTRVGQAAFAHATYTDVVTQEEVTATSSGTTGGAIAAIALRARVEGEEDA